MDPESLAIAFALKPNWPLNLNLDLAPFKRMAHIINDGPEEFNAETLWKKPGLPS